MSSTRSLSLSISPARWPEHLPVVQRLFRDYAAGLGVDLGFQDFEAELAGLPGRYAPPAGRVLLAWRGTQALACVAMRPVDAVTVEMKRLYVQPEARGEQLGSRLVQQLFEDARSAGYARMCLDTLPSMGAALRLYEAMGFKPVAPYVFNPIPGAMFLGVGL